MTVDTLVCDELFLTGCQARKAEVIRDFNAKYQLKPDPVLGVETLLTIHPLTAGFVRIDDGLPPSLMDVQEALAPILLIPPVPDDVRRTFHIAKRLHLFGHFEYSFFTVSQHYAFLALEAAVYSRWIAGLAKPVTIGSSNGSYTLDNVTHALLFQQWSACQRNLTVNGEPFPNSATKVLGRLEAAGVLSNSDRNRIEVGMDLRNELSHLETPTVNMPSVQVLFVTAELINCLFDAP